VSAELHEGDPALGDQATDETNGGIHVCRRLLYRQ
jgi:hypothetical protein